MAVLNTNFSDGRTVTRWLADKKSSFSECLGWRDFEEIDSQGKSWGSWVNLQFIACVVPVGETLETLLYVGGLLCSSRRRLRLKSPWYNDAGW
jgi:hypothetical protein